MATQQRQGFQLKDSVYTLEDPTVPGLYFRLGGDRPRLTAFRIATLAPATGNCRAALCGRAVAELSNSPHELVRVDA
jgi:hypothetical protein